MFFAHNTDEKSGLQPDTNLHTPAFPGVYTGTPVPPPSYHSGPPSADKEGGYTTPSQTTPDAPPNYYSSIDD